MSVSHSSEYYVRINGKVMGPFGMDQLLNLRDRGRLRAEHHVSKDRRKWKQASRIPQLFAEEPQYSREDRDESASESLDGEDFEIVVEAEPDSPKANGPPKDGWHYVIDGKRLGPASEMTIRQLLASGRLQPESNLWNATSNRWRPIAEIPQFRRTAKRNTRPKRDRLADAVSDSFPIRIWDAVLDSVRSTHSHRELETISTVMILSGGYSLLIAMLMAPTAAIYMALKTSNVHIAVAGFGVFAAMGVLMYLSQMMSVASQGLVASTPTRLSSSAFLDCMALLMLFIGAALASMLAMHSARVEDKSERILALIAAFSCIAVFGYAACSSLQKRWLNIQIDSTASAGEEGLGTTAFVVKLALRFTPVLFGVGCVIGVGSLIVASVWLAFIDSTSLEAAELATYGAGTMIIAALIPVAAYSVACSFFITLDLFRSVIITPHKLDRIASSNLP